MPSFEGVLSIFLDYLAEDRAFEVNRTGHGYLCLAYDSRRREWYPVRLCATPGALADTLLDAYGKYLIHQLCRGDRDLTPDEEQSVRSQVALRRELLR